MTVFLGIFFSYIGEIEVPYEFDWEHGTPQHAMQGNPVSSHGEGEVSCVFSSCGRRLGIHSLVTAGMSIRNLSL